MKKISILVLLVIAMSSCGVLKKRTVDLHTKSSDTSAHVDSSTVSKVNTVDKSETVVVEKAKGTVYSKPVDQNVSVDLSALLSGLQTVKDSGLVKIIQSYDSVTKQINTQVQVKPQAVDYDVNKTTVTKNDITTASDSKTSLKKDTKSSTDEKVKNTTSTPDTKLYVFLGLLIIGFMVYFGVKNKSGV